MRCLISVSLITVCCFKTFTYIINFKLLEFLLEFKTKLILILFSCPGWIREITVCEFIQDLGELYCSELRVNNLIPVGEGLTFGCLNECSISLYWCFCYLHIPLSSQKAPFLIGIRGLEAISSFRCLEKFIWGCLNIEFK